MHRVAPFLGKHIEDRPVERHLALELGQELRGRAATPGIGAVADARRDQEVDGRLTQVNPHRADLQPPRDLG